MIDTMVDNLSAEELRSTQYSVLRIWFGTTFRFDWRAGGVSPLIISRLTPAARRSREVISDPILSTRYSPLAARHTLRTRGFTLLEIILTLSLTLLLMAALYAALKLHLTMAHEGPRTVQRAQLARALLERIARDVRAAIPQPPPAESSTDSTATATGTTATGTATGSASTSSSATDLAAETDPYAAAFGILGGTDWIQIYVAQPRPDLDDAETLSLSGSVAQASNVVRVSYTLTPMATQPDAKGQTMRYVIARTAVPAIAAEQFDASSDEANFRAASDILCDDAGHLEFQYWDDTTGAWLDSWGTTTPLAPPRAVRVIISLLRPDEYLSEQSGLSGGQSTWRPNYQLVIPVSTWEPEGDEGVKG